MMNSVLQSAAAMRPTRTSTANSEGTGQKRREGCHGVLCEAKGCPFVFSSRRRHTRCGRDCSSDVCSSDLIGQRLIPGLEQKLVAAIELMLGTPYIKDLILRDQLDELKSAIARSHEQGLQTFDQPLYEIGRSSCRERV